MTDTRLTAEQRLLVESNVDLAHHLARDAWSRNVDNLDLEEVVSIAYQGLVKAALKFDPSKMTPETVANGKAFSGWARRWIVGGILEWQRQADHVQRSYRQIYKRLIAAGYNRRNLSALADELGEPVEKLRQIIQAVEMTSVSLDEQAGPDLSLPKYGEVEADHDVESSALEATITLSFGLAHLELTEEQQVIIALRYYFGLEFQQIAQEMEVTLNYVRDAHSEAILDLHEAMIARVRDQH